MLTKKQLCEVIYRDWTRDNGRIPSQDDITSFSILAVAMSYLGLLDDAHAAYAENRGCILFHWMNEGDYGLEQAVLSFRELLDLLPE